MQTNEPEQPMLSEAMKLLPGPRTTLSRYRGKENA